MSRDLASILKPEQLLKIKGDGGWKELVEAYRAELDECQRECAGWELRAIAAEQKIDRIALDTTAVPANPIIDCEGWQERCLRAERTVGQLQNVIRGLHASTPVSMPIGRENPVSGTVLRQTDFIRRAG